MYFQLQTFTAHKSKPSREQRSPKWEESSKRKGLWKVLYAMGLKIRSFAKKSWKLSLCPPSAEVLCQGSKTLSVDILMQWHLSCISILRKGTNSGKQSHFTICEPSMPLLHIVMWDQFVSRTKMLFTGCPENWVQKFCVMVHVIISTLQVQYRWMGEKQFLSLCCTVIV